MAPLDSPLTEAIFGKMPLDFVGNSILRWGGDRRTQLEFNSSERGWETDRGTVPEGSMWRKNPIPPGLWQREGPTFNLVCEESQACIDSYTMHEGGTAKYDLCKCSGLGEQLSTSLEAVVPAGTAPGRYVLQWRWDCEGESARLLFSVAVPVSESVSLRFAKSDQVWAGCSDITVAV